MGCYSGSAQLLGSRAYVLLAVVGIVMDQDQAAPAGRRRERPGRLAQRRRQRTPAAWVHLLQGVAEALHIQRFGRPQQLDVAAVAAPMAEGGEAHARLRSDLGQRAPHGVARQDDLADF